LQHFVGEEKRFSEERKDLKSVARLSQEYPKKIKVSEYGCKVCDNHISHLEAN